MKTSSHSNTAEDLSMGSLIFLFLVYGLVVSCTTVSVGAWIYGAALYEQRKKFILGGLALTALLLVVLQILHPNLSVWIPIVSTPIAFGLGMFCSYRWKMP